MILYQSASRANVPGFLRALSSSDVASLSTSGVTTLVFDLGEGWKQLRTVTIAGVNLTTSSGGACRASFSPDGTAANEMPGMTPGSLSGLLNYTGDVSSMVYQLLVSERYLRVRFTNGLAAQPASAMITVTGHDQ